MELTQTDEDKLLFQILKEEKLDEFHNLIRDELLLYSLQHFEFVNVEDLEKIGISRPAGRRLLNNIRKKIKARKLNNYLNGLWQPLKPLVQRNQSDKQEKAVSKLQPSPYYYIPDSDIEMVEQLGMGSFGVVWKAKWTPTASNQELFVAAKVLKQDLPSTDTNLMADFFKEVQSMCHLHHTNLIKLYGVVFSPPKMMIITELAENGSLRDRLKKECGHTPIDLLHHYAIQISSGMSYLESKRLIHRDLAARNILLAKKNTIKIGDFGLVRGLACEEDFYIMNESKKVPFPWCAPESLRHRQFSSASDCWMFGVTVWEMFSFGDEPWKGLNGGQVLQKIEVEGARLEKPNACSTKLYSMLFKCWDASPAERPNFVTMNSFLAENRPIELLAEKFFDGTEATLPADRIASSAVDLFSQRKPLVIKPNDRIQVIEDDAEFYLWKGQNQRTFEIGYFPLCITKETSRHSKKRAISRPLKGSLVHAAHGGIGGNWGSPGLIDKMYLENPMHPPDIMGFIDKELPPLPTKSNDKHKQTSPRRKQFGYNRFQNEDRESLLKESSFESFVRSRKDKEARKKNLEKGHPKRSLSCVQLKNEGVREDVLIDFSGEELIQERRAAELMNREHAAFNPQSHSFPETFDDGEIDPDKQAYSNVASEYRYYCAPNDNDSTDNGSESSFSDSEWARRGVPSEISDIYSIESYYGRRLSFPNLSRDRASPTEDPSYDPFNTSFVDRYTASIYEAQNSHKIVEQTPKEPQKSELSQQESNKAKPMKLDMNFIKQLEAKLQVGAPPMEKSSSVKPLPPPSSFSGSGSTSRRNRDNRLDQSLSESEESKKCNPPTAHVKPFLSSSKGPAPLPPSIPPAPSMSQTFSTSTNIPTIPMFPFSGVPSAPSREVVYGLASLGPTPDLNVKVDKLMDNVQGASREECIRALISNNMDPVFAMKELKLNELMKLGIADISRCTSCLEDSNWDLSLAAEKCFQ